MSSETMGLAQNILFWNVPDRPDESPTRTVQYNAAKNCELAAHRWSPGLIADAARLL
jgi:hypothetical protein